MLPSAPLSKHVLTLGVLEAVIDHTSVPFHEFRINWAGDTGVRPTKIKNSNFLPENAGLKHRLRCAAIIRSSWEPKFPCRNTRTGGRGSISTYFRPLPVLYLDA